MRALLIVLVIATLGCASAPRRDPFIGRAMDFEAERLDAPGTRLHLADLRGKVVLVDVWASWCLPCRDAIPAWSALRARVGDAMEVVGVSVDEERELATAFIAELAPGFPMVWDGPTDLMTRFPIETMPTLFVLDREGIVRFVHAGFDATTPDEIEARVRALLAVPTDPR